MLNKVGNLEVGNIIVVFNDKKGHFFGRVKGFDFDEKPGWFRMTFDWIDVRPHVVTWTLRESQINGEEFEVEDDNIKIVKLFPPLKIVHEVSLTKVFRFSGKEN